MRIIFHLLLLYLFLLPFGCTSSESSSRTLTEVSPIVITGKVTGTDEPIPLVYSTRYSRGISTMEDGGNFEFTFQTDQPEIFSMNYQLQRWHVFAKPGDFELFIRLMCNSIFLACSSEVQFITRKTSQSCALEVK